ncbi:anti-repressor SinI family protein [Virgibacillus sp. W0430]|uniref:anti-repressor SinI family protein n=1 Tax=Virgibacillus sp. W0430 TaxID=3391580 RepID=UPI003F4702E0
MGNKKEMYFDQEWSSLILKAKLAGLTKEQIRNFLRNPSHNNKDKKKIHKNALQSKVEER